MEGLEAQEELVGLQQWQAQLEERAGKGKQEQEDLAVMVEMEIRLETEVLVGLVVSEV